MSQFDMFADELEQLTAAEALPDIPVHDEPAVEKVEYAPVEPYEPRPETPAALAAWTQRTQRVNLVYLIGAVHRAPACSDFFFGMARDTLFKLDGLGGTW
ncbi:hypothetical protein PAMC26577_00795 [Caballeronia sordidicola]|uniref:Uncharacterized protein n=1 Tax=Caballeronia sordidicola TaxID=196367 RepID=A0A242N766_CABSO|nr:hypothetical protein PAMC26577_00795 [Caballeronia sordidicola]